VCAFCMPRIEARIRFPNLTLNVESDKPEQSLREINKILHAMKTIEFNKDFLDVDDDIFWRVGYISEELRSNAEAMKFLKQAGAIEPILKHKKIAVVTKQILDFDQKSYSRQVDLVHAKNKVGILCNGFESSSYALVHVCGTLTSDEGKAIVDMISQEISSATLHSVLTHKENMEKTVVEVVFCGSFDEE